MVQICMAANLKPILKMHDNHPGGQIYQFVAKRKLTNVSVQPPPPPLYRHHPSLSIVENMISSEH